MFRKRMLVLALGLVFLLAVMGCGGSGVDESSQQAQGAAESGKKASDSYECGTPVMVDSIVFTMTECAVNPVKGDRTGDNYADENGEYFAIGSEIVRAADYEQIEFGVAIENKSDRAIHFSEVGWEAELPDGYKFEHVTVEGKVGEQLPSNYEAKGKVIVTKERAIQADRLKLTYNLMDYNEEWQDAIWKAISGELTEAEYKAKFSPQPVVFDIELK